MSAEQNSQGRPKAHSKTSYAEADMHHTIGLVHRIQVDGRVAVGLETTQSPNGTLNTGRVELDFGPSQLGLLTRVARTEYKSIIEQNPEAKERIDAELEQRQRVRILLSQTYRGGFVDRPAWLGEDDSDF